MSLVVPALSRLALGVEYEGGRYRGWQRQREVVTVQQALEQSLANIAAHPVALICAGRTDAGVHASGQVVHFDTSVTRPDSAWTLGVNARLPQDIAVKWVKRVPAHFHARFSALARRYHYLLYNHPLRRALASRGAAHYHTSLDADKMHRAAQCLVGEHDFTAFRAAQCQSVSPWRNVHHISVTRYGRYVLIEIQANAFVHHMVRNIVGSLLEVGCGAQSEQWMATLLATKDRTLAAATAKPEGLYLSHVDYPALFALPQPPSALGFFAEFTSN